MTGYRLTASLSAFDRGSFALMVCSALLTAYLTEGIEANAVAGKALSPVSRVLLVCGFKS